MHSSKGNGLIDYRAHTYSLPGSPQVETSNDFITCTLLVCDHMASVIFDRRSIFSLVSSSVSTSHDLHCYLFDMPIRVSTLVSESLIVEKVYGYCLMNLVKRNTYVDLIILEMVDFDIIFGITCLSPNLLS